MLESEIIDHLKQNLKNLIPIEGSRINIRLNLTQSGDFRFDFTAEVLYKKLRFMLCGEVLGQAGMALLRNKLEKLNAAKDRDKYMVPVIVAPYLSSDKQEMCRRSGVNFIDLSGNVLLAYGSLYVERIGFPNAYPENRKDRNPFADKASLILRRLLLYPGKEWGIRELAQAASLDPGFVSRMAKVLAQRAYVIRKKANLKLHDAEGLIDDWVRVYNLQKNKAAGFFCMASDPAEILEKLRQSKKDLPNFVLSVQAGASLVAPYAHYNQVHVYVERLKQMDIFKNYLQLQQADDGANLILMLPFYKHAVFQHARQIKGLQVVSNLQLFLDLYHYPLRGREQAEHIYAKKIRPMLKKVSDESGL